MRTQIIAEEREYLVCYKPPGLAVQSGRVSEPDMVSELKNYLAAASGREAESVSGPGSLVRCGLPGNREPVYLGIVHRLDQPVSGLLVFAKSRQAAASLSRQAAGGTMQKTYRAVLYAPEAAVKPGGPARKLTDYMKKEPGGGARIAMPQEPESRKAELIYRILEKEGSRALAEIDLLTGRHHQIRLQMAHAGLPLLGDARYGSGESRKYDGENGYRTVQLQAVRLAFLHPVTGKKVCYELDRKLSL